MRRRPLGFVMGAAAIALVLSGCVANHGAGSPKALTVAITDTGCAVSANTTPSGTVTFAATNKGNDVNEFEILAADKLRISGEKENIGPGTTANLVVQLSPGTYYTACKKGMVGSPTGVTKFTVTDAGTQASESTSDTKALTTATTNYMSYLKEQSGQLLAATKTFAAAYAAGDDETARSQYAATRMYYERIEPTAESFGDIDPELDLRETDLESNQNWTGWHRIEKDLWPSTGFTGSAPDERSKLADALVEDTEKLNTLVTKPSFTLTVDTISNGASALMEEVSKSKITGEEEIFSHTDLWDFQANVEGAKVAYGVVRDITKTKGAAGKKLVTKLDREFATIEKLLAQYKTGDGYQLYGTLSPAQVKELSDEVNALSEPLSQLTGVVVR